MTSLVVRPADRAVAFYPDLLARAYELTRDVSEAQDVVQEAFVKCLATPPRSATDVSLRHWMRTVIANLVVDARRVRAAMEA